MFERVLEQERLKRFPLSESIRASFAGGPLDNAVLQSTSEPSPEPFTYERGNLEILHAIIRMFGDRSRNYDDPKLGRACFWDQGLLQGERDWPENPWYYLVARQLEGKEISFHFEYEEGGSIGPSNSSHGFAWQEDGKWFYSGSNYKFPGEAVPAWHRWFNGYEYLRVHNGNGTPIFVHNAVMSFQK